jgi:hypothetical protein
LLLRPSNRMLRYRVLPSIVSVRLSDFQARDGVFRVYDAMITTSAFRGWAFDACDYSASGRGFWNTELRSSFSGTWTEYG